MCKTVKIPQFHIKFTVFRVAIIQTQSIYAHMEKIAKRDHIVGAVSIFTHIFIEKRQFRLIQHRAFCGNAIFMYLRAILCTFQISVDFYYVPVGRRGGGRGGAGEGVKTRERGIDSIL